jgi:hypothetical protein
MVLEYSVQQLARRTCERHSTRSFVEARSFSDYSDPTFATSLFPPLWVFARHERCVSQGTVTAVRTKCFSFHRHHDLNCSMLYMSIPSFTGRFREK